MPTTERARYKNIKTGRIIFIVQKQGVLLQVKYVGSKHTSWFLTKDFVKIFTRVE